MNPMIFLNQMFQWAALNEFAKHLEKIGAVDGMTALLDLPSMNLPQEAWDTYRRAQGAGEDPMWIHHPVHGMFITHTFEAGTEDALRMICWAAVGPERSNELACEWWKNQGANPDEIVPGVTDLHRRQAGEE